MKYGAAVVLGALGMFVSGYFLGFTSAVPDVMRAANLNSSGSILDETITFDVNRSAPDSGNEGADPAVLAESDAEMEALRLREIEELKKMIVPLLTDDEIKKIREEAGKPANTEEAPTGLAPDDAPTPTSEMAPATP
jgi:hypothetical protein